jgi:hypothetical protein
MMIDEKLFNDAIQLASLWLAKSKTATPKEYREQVEGSVQTIYNGLVAVRKRIENGEV